MKGHKAHHSRKHRSTGGVNEAEEDLKHNPEERNNGKKIFHEAEEKKHGGRAKRKRGGRTERKHGGKVHKHHEHGEHMKHAKHVGPVKGKRDVHAGRAPRKSGGRTGSNFSPLSSAHAGTPPRGHKTVDVD